VCNVRHIGPGGGAEGGSVMIKRFRVYSRTGLAIAGAVSCIAASGVVGASAAQSAPAVRAGGVTVVAAGLNNPRSVTWRNGHLYVAEAGVGGTDCPAGVVGPEGGPLCVGLTGAIAEISGGHVRPVVTGLFSSSDLPGGLAAEGVAGLEATPSGLRAVTGESVLGTLAGLPSGAAFTPADNAAARAQAGRLLTVRNGKMHAIADVGDADYAWSAVHQNLVPDQFPDANPNYLKVVGRTTYVIDAGANTLDSVDRSGRVKQLAFFPNPAVSDAVPTCVDKGPDGALYVGQLAPGAPLGTGKIFRYSPDTHRLSVWKTGFNVVDGCGFDARGNFYVVEFQANGFNPGPTGNPAGDIIKIAPSGRRTVLGAGQLFYPQGFASDRSGNIYVSNWSILTSHPSAPGGPTGQVVRLRG
jgi:hypothetical protein